VHRNKTTLSPKEQMVLDKMMLGFSYKEMAGELDISPRTAELHGQRIMRKKRAPNRYVLMAWEFRWREDELLRKIASLEGNVITEQQ
jgi:DNA-binding CsgD family transcriptional regulator